MKPENVAIVQCGPEGEEHRLAVEWGGTVASLDHNLRTMKAFAAFDATLPVCYRRVQHAHTVLGYAQRHWNDWTTGEEDYERSLASEVYFVETDRLVKQLDYSSERIRRAGERFSLRADELFLAEAKLLAQLSERERALYKPLVKEHCLDLDRILEQLYPELAALDGDAYQEAAEAILLKHPTLRAAEELNTEAGVYEDRAKELYWIADELETVEQAALDAQLLVRDSLVALLEDDYERADKLAVEAATLGELHNEYVWSQFVELLRKLED